jgi:hypothetical protein
MPRKRLNYFPWDMLNGDKGYILFDNITMVLNRLNIKDKIYISHGVGRLTLIGNEALDFMEFYSSWLKRKHER